MVKTPHKELLYEFEVTHLAHIQKFQPQSYKPDSAKSLLQF